MWMRLIAFGLQMANRDERIAKTFLALMCVSTRSSVAAFDGAGECWGNELFKGACAKNQKKAVLPFAFRCLIERFCSAPYKERRFAFTMGKPLEGLVVKGS